MLLVGTGVGEQPEQRELAPQSATPCRNLEAASDDRTWSSLSSIKGNSVERKVAI